MSTNVKTATSEHISFFARLFSTNSSKRRTTEVLFSPTLKSQVSVMLEKKDFHQLASIRPLEHGTKLVIVMAKDHSYASLQLFDYIPYKYVEASPLYEFTDGNAESIYKELNGNLL